MAIWSQYGIHRQVALLPGARLLDNDLARIQLAFGEAGLNDFEIRDGQVLVERSCRDQYLKALVEHEALPDISRSLYEPDSSIDLWTNRQQQHEMSLNRKKKMIRQMILQLSFVADAYVDLDELTTAGFPPTTTRKVAAVIRPKNDRILESHQIQAIRDTICGQVAGLECGDVVVTDIAAGHAYHGDSVEASDAGTVGLIWLEQAKMTQRIQDQLAQYASDADVKLAMVEASTDSTPQVNPPRESDDPQSLAKPNRLLVNHPATLPEESAQPLSGQTQYRISSTSPSSFPVLMRHPQCNPTMLSRLANKTYSDSSQQYATKFVRCWCRTRFPVEPARSTSSWNGQGRLRSQTDRRPCWDSRGIERVR